MKIIPNSKNSDSDNNPATKSYSIVIPSSLFAGFKLVYFHCHEDNAFRLSLKVFSGALTDGQVEAVEMPGISSLMCGRYGSAPPKLQIIFLYFPVVSTVGFNVNKSNKCILDIMFYVSLRWSRYKPCASPCVLAVWCQFVWLCHGVSDAMQMYFWWLVINAII